MISSNFNKRNDYKVEGITFYPDLADIMDIYNDNIDVGVHLDDEYNYIVVVATQKIY